VRRAGEQGLSLTGPEGLLKQLTRTVLETALNEEFTEVTPNPGGMSNTVGCSGERDVRNLAYRALGRFEGPMLAC
jgi:hypothetical protein